MKEQEKEDTLANLVTYQSDLVDRGWPPGLCDVLVTELINCGYIKDTIDESDQPAVHVKEKITPSPSVGTFCPALSPPSLASQTPQLGWRFQA